MFHFMLIQERWNVISDSLSITQNTLFPLIAAKCALYIFRLFNGLGVGGVSGHATGLFLTPSTSEKFSMPQGMVT